MKQHERAGAIGGLGHAGINAGLAEKGGLLVAGDARHRDRVAVERRRSCFAEDPRARAHLGQRADGHVEQVEQLRVPVASSDVVEQRARSVGGVGDVLAGEAKDQPRVDRPEQGPPSLCPLTQARDVLEQPGDLRGREVRVEH